MLGRYHKKGEKKTGGEIIYPSKHTKENRRSGSGQKQIRFLMTLYGIFQCRCVWMEIS